MEKKAIILLSGGLDSATCLAYAKNQGFTCYAISFNYGQKQIFELQAAKKIAKQFSVCEHQIIDISIGKLGGSALTDRNIDIPKFQEQLGIPITYVPARNTIFLSIALGWAEILNANHIFIGVNQVDYSGYPDCREEFINAFTLMANLATKHGIEKNNFIIETPLINLNKSEIIKLGISLGVDYSQTVTCYQLDDLGYACGVCDSCGLRKQGFLNSGIFDPTKYSN